MSLRRAIRPSAFVLLTLLFQLANNCAEPDSSSRPATPAVTQLWNSHAKRISHAPPIEVDEQFLAPGEVSNLMKTFGDSEATHQVITSNTRFASASVSGLVRCYPGRGVLKIKKYKTKKNSNIRKRRRAE
jgi:hypothetical protein